MELEWKETDKSLPEPYYPVITYSSVGGHPEYGAGFWNPKVQEFEDEGGRGYLISDVTFWAYIHPPEKDVEDSNERRVEINHQTSKDRIK